MSYSLFQKSRGSPFLLHTFTVRVSQLAPNHVLWWKPNTGLFWLRVILVSGWNAARGRLMALTQRRTLTGKCSWLEFSLYQTRLENTVIVAVDQIVPQVIMKGMMITDFGSNPIVCSHSLKIWDEFLVSLWEFKAIPLGNHEVTSMAPYGQTIKVNITVDFA